MPQPLTLGEIDAAVRHAVAAYTQALDDGNTAGVVATFTEDGSVEIPGLGVHQGHEALHTAYARVVPRVPQRHLVLNTLITSWDDHEVRAASDVVFLLLLDDTWRVQLVGRYDDVLRREADGEWRFTSRTASFLP